MTDYRQIIGGFDLGNDTKANGTTNILLTLVFLIDQAVRIKVGEKFMGVSL